MPIWVRNTFIISILINGASLLWFLLGSTANFQRPLDLVEILILILVWFPSLVLVLFSTRLIMTGWIPFSETDYSRIWIMIAVLLFIAVHFFMFTNTQGWLNDTVRTEPLKVTSDGKYEYRIELVNMGQRNRNERLYIKDTLTNEYRFIPVQINTDMLEGFSYGPGEDWSWTRMISTEDSNKYLLVTTNNILPHKKFIIDVEANTAVEIDYGDS